MPSSTSGLTGTEILAYVTNYIGNQASDFQTFLTTLLPLAEFRFCKAHAWAFLNKTNLSLTVSSGTVEYDLSTSTVGYYMPASKVKSIFCPASGIYLRKVSLDEIRRMDPDENDGSSGQHLTHWCEIGDNRIQVYPPTFADTTLKVDGQITPSALLTLSNYPTIPYRYQESFIDYVIAMAMQRENDNRAQAAMQAAQAKIRADIQDDLANLGGTDEPRIRALQEQRLDGVSGLPDPLNMLFDSLAY